MALSAEDRWQIQDLLVRYAYLLDHYGTPEEDFLELFTDDAVIETPIRGRFVGIEGLREFARQDQQSWWAQPIAFDRFKPAQLRHFIGNVLIEGDGDRATLKAWLVTLVTRTKPGEGPQDPAAPVSGFAHTPTEFGATGHYECDAVKVAGKWKLKSRILYIDGVSGGPYDVSKTPWQELPKGHASSWSPDWRQSFHPKQPR